MQHEKKMREKQAVLTWLELFSIPKLGESFFFFRQGTLPAAQGNTPFSPVSDFQLWPVSADSEETSKT